MFLPVLLAQGSHPDAATVVAWGGRPLLVLVGEEHEGLPEQEGDGPNPQAARVSWDQEMDKEGGYQNCRGWAKPVKYCPDLPSPDTADHSV
jgi:hypothetical protein